MHSSEAQSIGRAKGQYTARRHGLRRMHESTGVTPWAPADDEKLKDLFFEKKLRILDIANAFSRSESAISRRIRSLGFKRKPAFRPTRYSSAPNFTKQLRLAKDALPTATAESLRADFIEQDLAFQKAMKKAGYERVGPSKQFGTKNPRFMGGQ